MRKDPDHEERNHKSNSETPGQPGSKEGKTEVTFILTKVLKERSITYKQSIYGACMVIQKENAHPNQYYWVTHTVTMNFLIYPQQYQQQPCNRKHTKLNQLCPNTKSLKISYVCGILLHLPFSVVSVGHVSSAS